MDTIKRHPNPGDDPHDPYVDLHFNPPLGSWGLHVTLEEAYPTTEEAREVLARATAASARSRLNGFGNVEPNALQSSPLATSRAALVDPEILVEMRERMNVWKLPGTRAPKQHHRRQMTGQERFEYREKRKVGACQKCRNRKKKVRDMRTQEAFYKH